MIGIFYIPPIVLLPVSFLGGAYIIIFAFFIPYKRERLFINGLVSALIVACIGISVGRILDLEGVVAIGTSISLIDVLSFTKYGKHTVNAKAMSNVTFMSKLVVYGKGKGDILYPTCGLGDFFYYAMWITGTHNLSSDISAYGLAVVMILLGSILNFIIIGKIYTRENYKGFPATILPFLCICGLYYMLYSVTFM